AGRLHFRAEQSVDAGKLEERKDGFLDAHVAGNDFARHTELAKGLPDHDARGDLGERPPDRLRDERYGTRRTWVHLEDVDDRLLDRELHVHQPADAELARERDSLPADLVLNVFRDRLRRQAARAIP